MNEQDLYRNYADSLSRIDTIVSLINLKFARYCDNSEKAEVLSEVLNDVKLVLADTANDEVH